MHTHDHATRPACTPAVQRRVGSLAPDLAPLADVIDQLYTDCARTRT